MSKIFLDTNVILYAFTDDPRSAIAERLLERGGDISVQVLNEFANVARRKLGFEWSEIEEALKDIGVLARAVHPVDLETHAGALALVERHAFSFYDALIVSSALRARCDILHSEDMQDGLIIGDVLRIVNPFRDVQQSPG